MVRFLPQNILVSSAAVVLLSNGNVLAIGARMPIPAFNINGVLPPFIGADGPGGNPDDMSPYEVDSHEVVTQLGTSDNRREILDRWLTHREQLRAIGVVQGFQWLDGSFVESKEPNDLDVVTFLRRPLQHQESAAFDTLVDQNLHLFDRGQVKVSHRLDAFFVDLNDDPERLVDFTRYWNGLFSHSRNGGVWKGMLKVDLDTPAHDDQARALLNGVAALGAVGPDPAA